MSDLSPLAIAPDAHLIRSLPDRGGPVRVAINSMVLTGTEPVLVDTGATTGRDEWWRQVESVVDPSDVRWIFLSHDEVDHYGNLVEALDRCPDATLVSSWLIGQRLAAHAEIPLDRCRWVNDGERFDLGERELLALRPPIYDSPTTRGLFDIASGIYWAADAFGVPVPHPVDDVAELDLDAWEEGSQVFHRLISPWSTQVEPARWRRSVARLAGLDVRTIATAHGPLVRHDRVGRALDLLSDLPGMPEAPMPGQAELEAILASLAAV